MAITVGSNIASLKAQRKLGEASDQLSRVFERLSSGQRINRSSDDAAGLAVAESLKARARIASVAIRNANDGISLVSIADGALAEIGNVLSRATELAEQGSNGVFSQTQRSALSNEFLALSSEIERLATTIEFNGVRPLSSTTNIVLQVGFDSTANSQITLTPVRGTLNALGLAGTGSSAPTFSLTGVSTDAAQSASRLALDGMTNAINSLSTTRGTLGAVEKRLEISINSLSVTRENLLAAESRIRDADIAADAAELTRLSILQQAGAAILAQANQQPSVALALLQ